MRLEKAIGVSLAIHLLVTGGFAISQGIKRCDRRPSPEPVFAELVPPPAVPVPMPETTSVAKIVEPGPVAPVAVAPPVTPPAPAAEPPSVEPAPAPAGPAPPPQAMAALDAPGPAAADNAAPAPRPAARIDPEMLERIRSHHQSVVSTAEFYRHVPAELTRLVRELLADGTLLAQGDALIHMDVTPSGQVGQAHVQANTPALLNRLDQVRWGDSLPPRPLAACNAIHLRISVVGNDIRVDVELL